MAEFGADWERRADLSATIEALPLVLDRYAQDTDAIFAANLDPKQPTSARGARHYG